MLYHTLFAPKGLGLKSLLLCGLHLFASMATAQETPFVATRVISLAPSATELAYTAGLGEHLIAASEYSDFPVQAQQLERIANHKTINLERVIALKPDLILAWRGGNPHKSLEQLKSLGYPIVYTDSQSLETIPDIISDLSLYTEEPAKGQQQAQMMRDRISELKQRYQNKPKVRFFYQLSAAPLITVSDPHWPSDVFALCGGENIFATSSAPYPQVGIEQVVVAQPEVLFTSRHANFDMSTWQRWQEQIPAIEQQHIWTLNTDWLNRPTLRSLLATEQVCYYLDQARDNHVP